MIQTKNLLTAEMTEWLQKSISSELYASHLYKHIANQMQFVGFFGAQKYWLKESADELTHYQIHVDFMNDMGTVAQLPAIQPIKENISTIEDALAVAYNTELALLNQYKEFYKIAEEQDCIVDVYLHQFIEIQRKAVGEYGDLIARYTRCGKNEAAILEFDEYLEEK
jgi:ferritin